MTQTGNGVSDPTRMIPTPGNSFGTHLEITSMLVSAERNLARAPLTDAVTTSAGSAALGLLVLMVDLAGSYPALASQPDWTATQDLALHATGWLTEGPVVADMHLVRMGKKVIVVEGEVYDAHGLEDLEQIRAELDSGEGRFGTGRLTPAARSLVTFVRLPRSAAVDADEFDPASWVGQVRQYQPDHPAVGTMRTRVGLQVIDPTGGVVEVAHSPYVANSIGTIGGAVQALAIEAAAEAMRPDLVATDVQIHFLSQVRTGPARTRGTSVRDAADHSVIRVELLDAGADDRLGAVATVTLQRPPS